MILVYQVNSKIGSIYKLIKKKIIDATFTTIATTSLIRNTATASASSNKDIGIVVFVVPGFLIDNNYYSSYLSLLNPSKYVAYSASSNVTLMEEANLLFNEVKNNVLNDNNKIVLIGHSRGAAVVSIASAIISQDPILKHRSLFSILLDPVDSNDYLAISNIQNYKTKSEILMIATPYGGVSKYYNTKFESSCAPIGRNADTFYESYSSKSNIISSHLLYVKLPSAGHLQLLDPGMKTSAVCASGVLSDEIVRSFIQTLIISWFSIVKNNNYERKDFDMIKSQLILLFPNISEWYYSQ